MAIRLEQIHPAVVHFPIALLPLSVCADLVGSVIRNKSLHSLGEASICVAAVGAVGSAATGLIAGEEVNVEGASMDMLMTHRNLNFLAAVIAGGMAIWRIRNRRPNAVYLLTGAIEVGVLAYTSFLGGKLVFDAGTGVGPARGVYRSDAPTLKPGQATEFVRTGVTDFGHGVVHMIHEVGQGNLIPTILAGIRKRSTAPEQVN